MSRLNLCLAKYSSDLGGLWTQQIDLFTTEIVYHKNLAFNNLFTEAHIYHFRLNLPVA